MDAPIQGPRSASGLPAIKCAALAALAIATTSAASAAGEELSASEYQLKAAFLYKFTKFVEWPKSAFESEDAPLVICVIGANPFNRYLESALRGQTSLGRRVYLRTAIDPEAAESCHLAFISKREVFQDRGLSTRLSRAGTLTVSDAAAFSRSGGAIEFNLINRKLRFRINLDAAERAQVTISSQLLELALSVASSAGAAQ